MNPINKIWNKLSQEKSRLDSNIQEKCISSIELGDQVTKHIIKSGGKRIRPLVSILIAKTLGEITDKHYDLATAIEFIHTATLLHDDVVDQSTVRRGKPTANIVFNNSAAILTGDFLYSRAFQLIIQNTKITSIISNATNELAMGEIIQLMNINKLDIKEDEYFRTIYFKTASLFSALTTCSAILSNRDNLSFYCQKFGENLGIAFQIVDDILDYTGHYGKNIGDDLSEKKLTLPIIYAMDSEYKKEIQQIFEEGNRDNVNKIISILKKTNSIEKSIDIAKKHLLIAQENLNHLPHNKYRDILNSLTILLVKRLK